MVGPFNDDPALEAFVFADRLYLSRYTVKTHVASIYDKLGVPGRSEAVEIVEQLGLGSTEAKVTIPAPDLD